MPLQDLGFTPMLECKIFRTIHEISGLSESRDASLIKHVLLKINQFGILNDELIKFVAKTTPLLELLEGIDLLQQSSILSSEGTASSILTKKCTKGRHELLLGGCTSHFTLLDAKFYLDSLIKHSSPLSLAKAFTNLHQENLLIQVNQKQLARYYLPNEVSKCILELHKTHMLSARNVEEITYSPHYFLRGLRVLRGSGLLSNGLAQTNFLLLTMQKNLRQFVKVLEKLAECKLLGNARSQPNYFVAHKYQELLSILFNIPSYFNLLKNTNSQQYFEAFIEHHTIFISKEARHLLTEVPRLIAPQFEKIIAIIKEFSTPQEARKKLIAYVMENLISPSVGYSSQLFRPIDFNELIVIEGFGTQPGLTS